MALFPLFKKKPQPKSYYDDEPQIPWYVTHRPLLFIGVGILILAVVAIGITIYISKNTPVAKLSYAITKDIDSGCDFHIEAAINEEPQMVFDGSAKITGEEISLCYDADYNSYTYQGVTLSQAGMHYSGSRYNDNWNITNVNTKVLDFMDFYTDLRHGYFDSNSFLRFLSQTEKYSSVEFSSLLGKVFPRFANENALTRMKLTEDSRSAVYAYDLDMDAFLSLLKDLSASAFFKSSDFDKFSEKIELNRDTLRRAKVHMEFEILKTGYLDNVFLSLASDDTLYTLSIRFDSFTEPTHTIPADFYDAADLINPNPPETVVTEAPTEPLTQAPTQPPTETSAEGEGEGEGEGDSEEESPDNEEEE